MILSQETLKDNNESSLNSDDEEVGEQDEPNEPVKLSELKPTSLLLSHQPLLSELDPRYACKEVSIKSLLKSTGDMSEKSGDEHDDSNSEDEVYFTEMKQRSCKVAPTNKIFDSSEEGSEENDYFSRLKHKRTIGKKNKESFSTDERESSQSENEDVSSDDIDEFDQESENISDEESIDNPSKDFLDDEAEESDGMELNDTMIEDDLNSNDESSESFSNDVNKGKDFLDSEAEESNVACYDDCTLSKDDDEEDEASDEKSEETGSDSEDFDETKEIVDELEDSKCENIKSQIQDISSKSKKMIEEFSALDSLEKKKSQAVQAQLGLLDNFLQMRTHLQGIIQPSNQLPPYDVWKPYSEIEDIHKLAKLVEKRLARLLFSLADLQRDLFLQNSQTKYVVEGEEELDTRFALANDESHTSGEEEEAEENEEDTKTEKQKGRKRKRQIQDVSLLLAKRHAAFKHYRDSTIEKWNGFIKSKSENDSFAAFEQPTLKQIEQILSDKDRLIKRTQIPRTTYKIIGKKEQISKEKTEEELMEDNCRPQEFNPEIFDDDDFYHQLLRYLMEHPFAAAKDSEAFKKYQKNLEKLRKSLKKKVDTRASKGRKIRYTVHPKLVNFLKPRKVALEQLCYPIYKYIAQSPP